MILPKNKSLLVCINCTKDDRVNIACELLKGAEGLRFVKGQSSWSLTSPSEFCLICNTCRTEYLFVKGRGIFLLRPLANPLPVDRFYALTLSEGGTISAA